MNAFTPSQIAAPRRWHLFILCFLVVAYVFTVIVPPLQAPDEFDHIERAYLLSHGHILLESENGSPSGGQIDQGLLDYMGLFIPLKSSANRKISTDELSNAAKIRWSNEKSSFLTPTGTAYYFPALYLPSAAALKIGEIFSLSISQSYRLARLTTLISCIVILIFAFRLYPPPMFALAVLALPMSLFLLSSAVLDAMATSVTVLALSAFMRTVANKNETPQSVIRVLTVSVALVAACRANLLPLLILPFAAYVFKRERRVLIWAVASSLFVLTWTIWTVKFTIYPQGARDVDHMARLLSYVFHPLKFFEILYTTVSDPSIRSFYVNSFIGVLGWLDTPLSGRAYHLFGALLITIFALSLSWQNTRTDWRWRGLLTLCAIASILLVFLALLVQWTIGPAVKVDGVQGRYFTIPVLIMAYALFGNPRPMAGIGELARAFLTGALLFLSIHYSVIALISRYQTVASQQDSTSINLTPSLPLSKYRPIQIQFDPTQISHPENLDSIGIRIGTYMTTHTGRATLKLWTNKGEIFVNSFDLNGLVDNAYRMFPLDSKAYTGGEIISDGGEGISTYEAHNGPSGPIIDCLMLHTPDNRSILTKGCPAP